MGIMMHQFKVLKLSFFFVEIRSRLLCTWLDVWLLEAFEDCKC